MDSIEIKEIVEKRLTEKDIESGEIYIIEKQWGYIVQIKNRSGFLNGIFSKNGTPICDIEEIKDNSGSIYYTEKQEDIYEKEKVHWGCMPEVQYVELDQNHFIIPRLVENEVGNYLFYRDEKGQIKDLAHIRGKIDLLDEGQKKWKQFSVREENNDTGRYFYSWDKNCRISDKWSKIFCPKGALATYFHLVGEFDFPEELVIEITNYMTENKICLATLSLEAKEDKEQHIDLICLIGMNGIPVSDLLYVTSQNRIGNIEISKDRIGEVEKQKEELQQRLEERAREKKQNREHLIENFFKISKLPLKTNEIRLEEDDTMR